MIGLLPPIGTKGIYTLKLPFLADDDYVYTCTSHRTVSDMVAAEVDVFAMVYEPLGIEHDVYVQARKDDRVIVTLSANGADTLHVPTDYITGYSAGNSVPHHQVIVTASCGLLPVDYDTSRIRAAVNDALTAYTGIESDVHIVVRSLDRHITEEEAIANAQIREQYITYRSTAFKDKIEAAKEIAALREANDELIRMIETLTQGS